MRITRTSGAGRTWLWRSVLATVSLVDAEATAQICIHQAILEIIKRLLHVLAWSAGLAIVRFIAFMWQARRSLRCGRSLGLDLALL